MVGISGQLPVLAAAKELAQPLLIEGGLTFHTDLPSRSVLTATCPEWPNSRTTEESSQGGSTQYFCIPLLPKLLIIIRIPGPWFIFVRVFHAEIGNEWGGPCFGDAL